MEKYIITYRDGSSYVATEINRKDIQLFNDGVINIIRCSDAKVLSPTGEWMELKEWR